MKVGKILLIPRGNYSDIATYAILDWVKYNGKIWVCKLNNTIGVTPEEGANWTLLVEDGFNPSASVAKNGHTITISITDKTGSTIATIVEPIASITKVGNVSTITIVDANGTSTVQVYDGNRWFRGTEISGKSKTEQSYNTTLGYVNAGDNYINIDEGGVYHCTSGGLDNVAKWTFDFILTGGGGGGSQAWINDVELSGRLTSTDLGISWTGTLEEFNTDNALNLIPEGTTVNITNDFTPSGDAIYYDTYDDFLEAVNNGDLVSGQRATIIEGSFTQENLIDGLQNTIDKGDSMELQPGDVSNAQAVYELNEKLEITTDELNSKISDYKIRVMSTSLSFGSASTLKQVSVDISSYGFTDLPFVSVAIILDASTTYHYEWRLGGASTNNTLYFATTSDRDSESNQDVKILLIGK